MTRAHRAALTKALGPRRRDLARALVTMIEEHRAYGARAGVPADPRGKVRAAHRVHRATITLRRALDHAAARGMFAGYQDLAVGGRTLRAWLAELERLAAFVIHSRRRGRRREVDRLWFAAQVAKLLADHQVRLTPARSGLFVRVLDATLKEAGEFLPADLRPLASQAIAVYHRLEELEEPAKRSSDVRVHAHV